MLREDMYSDTGGVQTYGTKKSTHVRSLNFSLLSTLRPKTGRSRRGETTRVSRFQGVLVLFYKVHQHLFLYIRSHELACSLHDLSFNHLSLLATVIL